MSALGEAPPTRQARPSEPAVTAARVRMALDLTTARILRDHLADADPKRTERLLDQLWLRMCLIEQRRRTRMASRARFDERADRLLAALDP